MSNSVYRFVSLYFVVLFGFAKKKLAITSHIHVYLRSVCAVTSLHTLSRLSLIAPHAISKLVPHFFPRARRRVTSGVALTTAVAKTACSYPQ